LHIGTTKTGTKSLQGFLQKNRLVLDKKGILYPRTFGEINQVKLAHYVWDFDKIDYLKGKLKILNPKFIKAGLISKERAEDFHKEILSSFQKEIQNTNCTKLLISSEAFASFSSVKEIQSLKKFLDDFVKEYTIIVYLRSQPERATSDLTTRCVVGTKTEGFFLEGKFTTFFPKNFFKRFNYEKLLEGWANVFGEENIVPKIFSRKGLLDGDIKKDFVSLLGWNWNDFEDVESRNESMSADAQRFMMKINKVLPRFIGNKVNENHGNIGHDVSRNFKGKGLQPPRKEAENFFKMFKDSNEKVRRRWFAEKKELFEVDFDKYPEKKELFVGDFEKDYAFAFEVFAKLLSEKLEQISSLKEQLKDKKYLQEQINTQQSKFDQLILNREQHEKQIISEKDYTYAFEVFAKLWSKKLEEIRYLKKKLKQVRHIKRELRENRRLEEKLKEKNEF